MHPLIHVGIAAALLALATPAQQGQSEHPTRGQQERARTQRPARSEPGERPAGPRGQQDPSQGSQPGGETKPGGEHELTPEQRDHLARRYLEEHPEVRQQLRQKADADGDGKLSEEERTKMKQMVEAKLKEVHQQAEQRREERRERNDTNDDGRVGPAERERAQERRERNDTNDDGRVGPAERERAREQGPAGAREQRGQQEPVRPTQGQRERGQQTPQPQRDRQRH